MTTSWVPLETVRSNEQVILAYTKHGGHIAIWLWKKNGETWGQRTLSELWLRTYWLSGICIYIYIYIYIGHQKSPRNVAGFAGLTGNPWRRHGPFRKSKNSIEMKNDEHWGQSTPEKVMKNWFTVIKLQYWTQLKREICSKVRELSIQMQDQAAVLGSESMNNGYGFVRSLESPRHSGLEHHIPYWNCHCEATIPQFLLVRYECKKERSVLKLEGWFAMDPLSSQTGWNYVRSHIGIEYCQISSPEYVWICFGEAELQPGDALGIWSVKNKAKVAIW